jgi:hypothetical protein
MIWLVTSGSVAIVVTFLTVSRTRACDSSVEVAAAGTATAVDIAGASVALGVGDYLRYRTAANAP